MSEKLALEQGLWQSRAVHGDKGRLGARARAMDAAGDQFLAGTGLALDQNRDRGEGGGLAG